MAAPRPPGFDTLSLHAGQQPDPINGARAVPIYQTTSFVFENTDQAAALFNLESPGYVYSRISNPTVAVLEERLAALEGGVGCVCTASGMAAMHVAIATLLGAGDHIVTSPPHTQLCTRCFEAPGVRPPRYCSTACQRAHWPAHKSMCGRAPAAESG